MNNTEIALKHCRIRWQKTNKQRGDVKTCKFLEKIAQRLKERINEKT